MSSLEELEQRIIHIERILTSLESVLSGWGADHIRYSCVRPGQRASYTSGKRSSPFEGMQDFPENIAARVEAALLGEKCRMCDGSGFDPCAQRSEGKACSRCEGAGRL